MVRFYWNVLNFLCCTRKLSTGPLFAGCCWGWYCVDYKKALNPRRKEQSWLYSRRFATATARTASLGSHSRDISIYIKIIYVHIEWTVHTVNDVSHCSLLLPLFSSIAVAPRQEPLCGRHGLNDVVLTPSRPLVTANDVGHWDQKHPKVLIVGKKTRRIW